MRIKEAAVISLSMMGFSTGVTLMLGGVFASLAFLPVWLAIPGILCSIGLGAFVVALYMDLNF